MSLIDDVDDYKLDTTFQSEPKCVIHKSYRVDRARGLRKAEVLERWFPYEKVLGAGAFGTVRLEKRLSSGDHKDTLKMDRAVKQLYKWQLERLKVDFRRELLALTKFSRSKFRQYQVFVEFWGWYENEESIFLTMEYFPRGTLRTFIDSEIDEDGTRSIATQLLEGLSVMHLEGFTHRDLKPENIFVVQTSPEWWIKIGDFGISKRVSNNNTIMQTATGSPNYLAPEVHGYATGADSESSAYTNAVDVWSFGCVIYEIIALKVPFPLYPRDVMRFCRGAPFPKEPLADRVSKEGIDFVKMALQPHPIHRPAASQMLNASWIQVQYSRSLGKPLDPMSLEYSNPTPPSTEGSCELEDEEGNRTIAPLQTHSSAGDILQVSPNLIYLSNKTLMGSHDYLKPRFNPDKVILPSRNCLSSNASALNEVIRDSKDKDDSNTIVPLRPDAATLAIAEGFMDPVHPRSSDPTGSENPHGSLLAYYFEGKPGVSAKVKTGVRRESRSKMSDQERHKVTTDLPASPNRISPGNANTDESMTRMTKLSEVTKSKRDARRSEWAERSKGSADHDSVPRQVVPIISPQIKAFRQARSDTQRDRERHVELRRQLITRPETNGKALSASPIESQQQLGPGQRDASTLKSLEQEASNDTATKDVELSKYQVLVAASIGTGLGWPAAKALYKHETKDALDEKKKRLRWRTNSQDRSGTTSESSSHVGRKLGHMPLMSEIHDSELIRSSAISPTIDGSYYSIGQQCEVASLDIPRRYPSSVSPIQTDAPVAQIQRLSSSEYAQQIRHGVSSMPADNVLAGKSEIQSSGEYLLSGTSQFSVNNPKILEQVESSVLRFIQPDLTALKRKISQERQEKEFYSFRVAANGSMDPKQQTNPNCTTSQAVVGRVEDEDDVTPASTNPRKPRPCDVLRYRGVPLKSRSSELDDHGSKVSTPNHHDDSVAHMSKPAQ